MLDIKLSFSIKSPDVCSRYVVILQYFQKKHDASYVKKGERKILLYKEVLTVLQAYFLHGMEWNENQWS